MNKSFLFNITNQEGLPGGANETKSSLLGSVSISQQTSIPQFNTGGVVSPGDGWEYKKEGDLYLTRRAGKENWITARGAVENAIKTKIFKETPANTATQINETEVKSLREYNPNKFSNKNYVIDLQTKLKKAGYDIGSYGVNKDGIDGIMGAKTKAALDAFNKGVSPESLTQQKAPGRVVGKTATSYQVNKNLPDGFLPTMEQIPYDEVCSESGCSFNVSKKMGNLLGNIVEGGSGTLWAGDAWFNKSEQLNKGGDLVYETKERDFSRMGTVPKEVWNKLQVGDYVQLNRADTKSSKEFAAQKKAGYENENIEHLGFIIGKDKDGVPLVWHGSEKGKAYIQRLDEPIRLKDHDARFTYQVSSIVRNPKMKNVPVEELKKLQENAYYRPLDENKKLVPGSTATSTQKDAAAEYNKLQGRLKALGYSQDDILKVGQLLIGGIMENESKGNESTKRYVKQAGAYIVKDLLGQQKAFDRDQASWGVYQMKDDYNFKNDDGSLNAMGKKLKSAGVDPDKIFDNIGNETVAGAVILLDNYDKLKKDPNYDPKTDQLVIDGQQIPSSYILAKSWQAGEGWQTRDKYQGYLKDFDIDYSNNAIISAAGRMTIQNGTKDVKKDVATIKKQVDASNAAAKKHNAEMVKKDAEWRAAQEKAKQEREELFRKENPQAYYDLNFTNASESTGVHNLAPIRSPYDPIYTTKKTNNFGVGTWKDFKQEGGVTYADLTDEEIEQYRKGGWIIEEYDKGGLFTKKKSSSEYKPGAWANAETSTDKIYTEGEDAFDMPISKVPEAEFAVQDMSEEELQAYLQKSEQQAFQEKYKQAYDQYKPKSVSYKNVQRPSAEFVLQETYENNPQAFTDAGYTASQLESGNYELFSNQDISNMIYKKGFSPDVLSNTFGIGKSEELETKFSPVYADAKRIHAKRNAEKIDNLVKQGYDVKGAIQELANQGEGTVEGLTKRYNDYATESYNEENYSKQLAEKVNQQYNDKVSKDIEDLRSNVLSFDKNSIASVDQPIMTANYDMQGNITGYGDNTAYTRNVNALAELSNYEDNLQQAPERIARDAMLALANSDLTNDQKRALLSNPEKLTNLMQEYGAWEQADEGFAPSGDVGYYRGGRFKSPFRITAEGDAQWTEGEAPRVIDGGVNMLDKQWIKGTLGVIAAPAAFEALGSAMSYSAADAGLLSAGRIGSTLNAGNVFTGMGVYDVATDIAPDAYNQIVDMTQHGITKDNLLGLGKDVIEGGTKLLSGTKLLNEVGILSKAPSITKLQAYKTGKDLYAQGKYGSRVAAEELTGEAYNVKDNMKFIKSLAPFMKKQEGGVTYTELTDEEIKAYREGGWIIEEM